MLTKKRKFMLAGAGQVGIILAIILFKVTILTAGTDVLLKIKPVDPRDMLRGDYATFRYDISTIGSYDRDGNRIKNGDTVYVVLSQTGTYWTVQSVQKSKPHEGNVFIKGKVASGGERSQNDPFSDIPVRSSRIHVTYGIEQYFIPEGKGRNLNFANREAAARVALDDSGNAVLRQVYLDNRPWP